MSWIHVPSSASTGCYVEDTNDKYQGLAFGLVIAAGLSTVVGAAISFFLPHNRSSKNLVLSSFLGIAAGVMIYVSFVEIFAFKAVPEFEKCYKGIAEKYAVLYATLCFFAGIAITAIFDKLVHVFQRWYFKKKKQQLGVNDTEEDVEDQSQTEDLKKKQSDASDGDGEMIASMYDENSESAKLIRMGLFAAIALAFHNFPEGLATYIAVLVDPKVGASVAIAIAIHNIPEGICVAIPIYYATGSRLKACFWAFLSGMTELVGALLGFIVLKSVITPEVYGALFGIVAGMMVYISIKELLPAAHAYDPEDKVTSISFIVGMGIMALSIVLFSF